MNEKKNPWLYRFSIDKEVTVEKEVEEQLNGETVKVKRKVTEKTPVQFALKKPTRKLLENADVFYGVKLSEGIRMGLLTKALLFKRYRNDGGALSDADTKYFDELTEKLGMLEDQHVRAMVNVDKIPSEEREKKISDIIQQKMDVLRKLQVLETINQALFAHTAESKAQQHLTNWWIVYLSYCDPKGGEEFVEFIPGATYDEKMDMWDKMDAEDESSFTTEAISRLSLLIGLWTAGAKDENDFAAGEKEYGSVAQEAVAEVMEAKAEAKAEAKSDVA